MALSLIMLVSGCTAVPDTTAAPPPTQRSEQTQASWWYIRFRLRWPAGKEAPWFPDLLLADQVIRPILTEEREAILLWRFHRRAARDQAGRQFSFIFRATPATAMRINAGVLDHPWVARLRKRGILEEVTVDAPSQPQRLTVAETSDPNWSPAMQAAWPYFIMGVSRLWLELIREINQQVREPREPLRRYAAIENAVNAHWRTEGGHALLHHLSGIFGYRAVLVTRNEAMRF